MSDNLLARPKLPPRPLQPGAAAATPPKRAEPSQEEIEAILARAEQDHRARFPAQPTTSVIGFAGVATGTLIPRLLFTAAALVLISQGVEGLSTRAVSSNSLIAVSINRQGGQSLGLGLAMLALATLPYPRGKAD